jgi:RNA 3'-terminal phosphate cyclase (ATP)
VRIYSKASADLAERDVAERQAASAAERLRVADARASAPTAASEDVPVRERTHSTVETTSTGSAVAVALDFEETVAGFDALGAQGKPAEEVGWEVAESALEFLDGPGAVDAHLADQLVVLLALAGGRVAIPAVTDHVRTCVDLVAEFGFPVAIRPGDPPVLSAER